MNETCEINKLPCNSKWESLSEYERKRYSNVVRNWEVLKSLGVATKLPKFLEPEEKGTSQAKKIQRNQKSISRSQRHVKGFEKTNFKLFAVSETQKRKEKNGQKKTNQNSEKKLKLKENISPYKMNVGDGFPSYEVLHLLSVTLLVKRVFDALQD
ncbi:uncharacterized protein [Parasteatoda tepidariorum]|uniref:uncharacterized protein n=1 Tax=Parasteatoda tepidariorum TaxID=114398 RepID=UPI0039BCDA66